MIKKQILQYTVIYTPEAEGGYTVSVPKLPGCITYGKDMVEAKKMAKDAIKLYLESLSAHDEQIPVSGKDVVVGKVDLEMPTVHA